MLSTVSLDSTEMVKVFPIKFKLNTKGILTG
jgi:hypothetical protein